MLVKQKNMKTRIKHVISLSILLSILFFLIILSFSSADAERTQGYLLASMISNMASSEIFSPEVLDTLDLNDLDYFNSKIGQSAYRAILVKRIKAFEDKILSTYTLSDDVGRSLIFPKGLKQETIPNLPQLKPHDITKGVFAIGEIAQIRVSIGDGEIYRSTHWGSSIYLKNFVGKPIYPIIKILTDFFRVEAICHVAKRPDEMLPAVNGVPFATVSVRLDPSFLVSYYALLFTGMLFSAIVALIISNIITKLLSRNLSKPFTLLESKLRSLALEDYETTLHSQIVFKKRPISEIESIAYSTNTIIHKMQQFNTMQTNQKGQLESVKYELESQKEELLESRHIIQEAQSQLVQSQNLASIGQLTAAISHEIDEPLSMISFSVEKQNKLIERLKNIEMIQRVPENRDFVQQLAEAGNLNNTAFTRISSIIGSLRNFSRLDVSEMEQTDINENIKSVVLLTSNLWKRRINMHEDYGSLPLIFCYPGLINQVFMNVVVNAIHAIPEKGDISIRTSYTDGFISISIKDNGTGISEDILPMIFETGFTTKKCGKGSGLGLAISKDIMKKHNGKIEVHSTAGEGSEFVIILPNKRIA